uniref:Protein-L-isoaspartate O-methyltransferase domain-containing protein 1 n=3 Tax=Dendroctonus ponderosae TaxID=77166 RepID=A0AAR5QA21_DENPD
MGAAASTATNNDELVDNLIDADYIIRPIIERVFRAVDRAEYFLPEALDTAYKDQAWKKGNLHISSPGIYAEVMEALEFEPGLSFLNMGSGTGYFSTVVGLILGTNGINHGIEIHADVIDYANERLEDFKKLSGAIDEFDFCEPKFIQGNCLTVTDACAPLYDRIYCGAACPEEFQQYMQNRLKLGGILVLPLNDQLMRFKRESVCQWEEKFLIPVSFASLVRPTKGFQDLKPIEVAPLPLQILCRSVIRDILRKNIEKEHSPVKKPSRIKVTKKCFRYRGSLSPFFPRMDSSDQERQLSLTQRSSSNPSLHGGGLGTTEQVGNTGTDEQGTEDSANNHRFPRGASIYERRLCDVDPDDIPLMIELYGEHAFIDADISEALAVRHQHQNKTRADLELAAAATPSTSTRTSNQNGKRQKWDSGLEEEIIETHESSDDESMGLDAIFSGDEDDVSEKRFKRDSSSEDKEDIADASNDIDSSSKDEEEIADRSNHIMMYQSLYTPHMVQRIQELPLPPMMKKYLNCNRDMNIEDGE